MILESFINWLRFNRNFSERTVGNYQRAVKLLDEYIKEISLNNRSLEDVEKISLLDINGFIRRERLRGKDVMTCNLYLAGIKSFLCYCGLIGKDVINYKLLVSSKAPRKKIDSLRDEDCERLIKYFRGVKCKTRRDELIKTRNLLICQLLLYTWLRVSELANLKIKDIQEETQIIGKGWKRRILNLFEEDLKLIDLYLFMRKDKSERLLVSHSSNSEGQRLTTVSIDYIIRDGAKKAGIDGKVRPHKLRHTFATNLLRNKANLFHIQELLGHSSIQTTQTYITVLNSEIRETQEHLKRY